MQNLIRKLKTIEEEVKAEYEEKLKLLATQLGMLVEQLTEREQKEAEINDEIDGLKEHIS